MPRRKPPQPHQDPLDPILDLTAPPASAKAKKAQGAYLVQLKVANPPMCILCINEMNDGTRKRAVPNRVTHRGWLPKWKAPVLMCSLHASDFAVEHNLGRA